jgi:protein-tyrosine-phosphatase
MAEAITRGLGGKRVDARSAGLAPLGWLAEPTIAVLEARGFSTEGLSSKGLNTVEADDLDVVVSLIGEHGLSVLPPGMGARREAWAIPDPFGEDEVFYLDVARQLEDRIRRLLLDELQGELSLT